MTYLLLLRAFDTLKLLKQINRFSEQYWGFHKALEPTEMDLTTMAQKNELRNNCWTTFQQENDFLKMKSSHFLSKDPIDSDVGR